MKRLYVLYDEKCALCAACRRWLGRQPAFIELKFIPLQSAAVQWHFPSLTGWKGLDLREQLVVVSDEGAVYQGPHAWIMCLYALCEYREWAQRLAQPMLLPFARTACDLISKNRLKLSRLFAAPDKNLHDLLAAQEPTKCGPGINSCKL